MSDIVKPSRDPDFVLGNDQCQYWFHEMVRRSILPSGRDELTRLYRDEEGNMCRGETHSYMLVHEVADAYRGWQAQLDSYFTDVDKDV